MTISAYFSALCSAYQAELDDLSFDTEGRDVLHQRLAEKRKLLNFLTKMMETNPEMVAVVFHHGFEFKLPAVMAHLLSLESEDLPDWDSLSDAVQLKPWAIELSQIILKEAQGEWFLTVAAALEYVYHKPALAPALPHDVEDADHEQQDADARLDAHDDQRDSDSDSGESPDTGEEAGADWLVEQGFERKE
jgi:hypothetical protein